MGPKQTYMGLRLSYMGLKLSYMRLELSYMGLKLTYMGLKLSYMGLKLPYMWLKPIYQAFRIHLWTVVSHFELKGDNVRLWIFSDIFSRWITVCAWSLLCADGQVHRYHCAEGTTLATDLQLLKSTTRYQLNRAISPFKTASHTHTALMWVLTRKIIFRKISWNYNSKKWPHSDMTLWMGRERLRVSGPKCSGY